MSTRLKIVLGKEGRLRGGWKDLTLPCDPLHLYETNCLRSPSIFSGLSFFLSACLSMAFVDRTDPNETHSQATPILPLGVFHIWHPPYFDFYTSTRTLCPFWSCYILTLKIDMLFATKLWGILGADIIYGSSLSPSLLSPYFAGSLFMLSFYTERKAGKEASLKKVLWGFVIAFKLV